MHAVDHILIFARYPASGQAKTRLIPALGPDGAAHLHRRMAEHVVAVARTYAQTTGAVVTVRFTGAPRRVFRAWLGDGLHYEKQSTGDLGDRMRVAFQNAFGRGAERVLAVGTDVPALSESFLRSAFQCLRDHDVVLGPATDGGYTLIGMRCDHPSLFAPMAWGTSDVYGETSARVTRLGLSMGELPILGDVDRPEDLDALRDVPEFAEVLQGGERLSVVIPTLNEEACLSQTLACIQQDQAVEVIVADGGSHDATCRIAGNAGVTVVKTAGGRAVQLNDGAAVAHGCYLLFLHADTRPPDDYADKIRCSLAMPGVVAGAFGFRLDGDGAAMRLVEWGTNLRSRLFSLPYGDQGLFMEKRVFVEQGGFADFPIMEDFDFVKRLRRRGKIHTLRVPACTSARRWQRLGVFRTTLCNQGIIAGYLLGVRPDRLARFYR